MEAWGESCIQIGFFPEAKAAFTALANTMDSSNRAHHQAKLRAIARVEEMTGTEKKGSASGVFPLGCFYPSMSDRIPTLTRQTKWIKLGISSIHGCGIFAAENIPSGTIIVESESPLFFVSVPPSKNSPTQSNPSGTLMDDDEFGSCLQCGNSTSDSSGTEFYCANQRCLDGPFCDRECWKLACREWHDPVCGPTSTSFVHMRRTFRRAPSPITWLPLMVARVIGGITATNEHTAIAPHLWKHSVWQHWIKMMAMKMDVICGPVSLEEKEEERAKQTSEKKRRVENPLEREEEKKKEEDVKEKKKDEMKEKKKDEMKEKVDVKRVVSELLFGSPILPLPPLGSRGFVTHLTHTWKQELLAAASGSSSHLGVIAHVNGPRATVSMHVTTPKQNPTHQVALYGSLVALVAAHAHSITPLEKSTGVCATTFDLHFVNLVQELMMRYGRQIRLHQFAVYESAGMFNHACMEDAEIVRQGETTSDSAAGENRDSPFRGGNKIQVRTTRNIFKGEEIKLNYGDLLHKINPDHTTRRAQLHKFGFHCMCHLCVLQDEFPYNPNCECRLCRTMNPDVE